MKKMKKIFALLIAMVMVLGMSTMAFATELPEGTAGADKTITITTPSGLAAADEVTYTVYRVFAADSNGSAISYKLLDGVTTAPSGFIVDDGGNVYLGTSSTTETGADGEIKTKVGGVDTYITPQTGELTQTQIDAIAAYTYKEEVGTVTITGPSASKTVTVPEFGYFYITTTTGTLVSIDSTNKSATITDKNSSPQIDKVISDASSYDDDGKKALAEVGSEVEYTVTITVGQGRVGYVMTDTLGTGLSYVSGSLEVEDMTEGEDEDYTLSVSGQIITVTFNDETIADLEDRNKIVVTYKATVTSDALQDDPANNSATISYGRDSDYTSTSVSADVYNAKITVVKEDGDGEALAGAGFILKKNSDNKYYHYENGVVTWVAEAQATEYTTSIVDDVAQIAFAGLADGEYTLIEKTVPAGYNKAADIEITVAANTYTEANLSQSKTVVNNSGSVLPSTGGMGTTIFYIVGAILVIGAGVVLVSRRRMNAR